MILIKALNIALTRCAHALLLGKRCCSFFGLGVLRRKAAREFASQTPSLANSIIRIVAGCVQVTSLSALCAKGRFVGNSWGVIKVLLFVSCAHEHLVLLTQIC